VHTKRLTNNAQLTLQAITIHELTLFLNKINFPAWFHFTISFGFFSAPKFPSSQHATKLSVAVFKPENLASGKRQSRGNCAICELENYW
jgi:hypothetical protein